MPQPASTRGNRGQPTHDLSSNPQTFQGRHDDQLRRRRSRTQRETVDQMLLAHHVVKERHG
jgi:hypothetical protein